MREDHQKLLREVYDQLFHLEHYDNKNLRKRQDETLLWCLEVIDTILNYEEIKK